MAGTGDVNITSKAILQEYTRAFAMVVGEFRRWIDCCLRHWDFRGSIGQTCCIGCIYTDCHWYGRQHRHPVINYCCSRSCDWERLTSRKRGKFCGERIATGASLGGVYGILLGTFAKFRFSKVEIGGLEFAWEFPIVVALAICVNMLIASTIGTLIPMVFKRMQVDPAIATGPFVTTSIDVFGILTYFTIARLTTLLIIVIYILFSHIALIFRIIDLCNLEFSHTRSWGIYSQTRKNHQGTTVNLID